MKTFALTLSTYGPANAIHAFCQRNFFLGGDATTHFNLLRYLAGLASQSGEAKATLQTLATQSSSENGDLTRHEP